MTPGDMELTPQFQHLKASAVNKMYSSDIIISRAVHITYITSHYINLRHITSHYITLITLHNIHWPQASVFEPWKEHTLFKYSQSLSRIVTVSSSLAGSTVKSSSLTGTMDSVKVSACSMMSSSNMVNVNDALLSPGCMVNTWSMFRKSPFSADVPDTAETLLDFKPEKGVKEAIGKRLWGYRTNPTVVNVIHCGWMIMIIG